MKQDHLKQTKTPPSAAPPAGKPGLSAFKSGVGIESLCILIIVLATTLIYSNTLNSPFVLDDLSAISGNRHIRISDISVGSILNSFRENASRPVPIISFALNYYFGKYNPLGYHLVNISIHALSGIVLFWLIKVTLNIRGRQRNRVPNALFLPDSAIAFLSALLWTVHPVNTQSVTYIVQRMNSLSALFGLLVLISYIKGRIAHEHRQKTVWFSLTFGAWILALGSKETAAILPFVVLLYEWYFFQDLSRDWLKRNLKYFIGGGGLIIILALIYTGFDPIGKLSSLQDFSEARFTLTERVLTQFRVVVYYLSLFLYPNPSRLNLDYDFPLSHSLFDPVTTLLSALLLIGLIFAGILTARKNRLVSFCIFWYFLKLAIESSIIPLAIIFEHRTYMPFMGLALLVVVFVDRYLKPLWLKIILMSVIVSVCGLWTYQRNATWQDPVTLWQDVVNKSPSKARPHTNLGKALHDSDKVDDAIANYKAALKIEPNQKAALNNLGLALKDQNKTAEAIAYFKAALKIDPADEKALNNLGVVFKDQNQTEEAIQCFKAAIKSKPNFTEALTNLGAALMDQGLTAQAIPYFRAALKIDPLYIDALNSLGAAFLYQENPDSARRLFEAALKIDSQDVSALNHLGLMYISKGDISKALELFKHAARIEPDSANTHVNLGAAYQKTGQYGTAILHLETALKLDPEIAQAHTNIGIGLMQRGDFLKGLFHINKAVELEPDNEEAQSNLNRALALKQQIETNIVELRRAANADPQNSRLYSDLAKLYQSIGDGESTIKALNRALEIEPDSDTLLNSLGNFYLANGQYGPALKVFERHLDLDPDFSLPYYNIARWHAKQNRTTEAVEWLKRAISRGYANWQQIDSDADLDSIRNTLEYKALVKGH